MKLALQASVSTNEGKFHPQLNDNHTHMVGRIQAINYHIR